MEQRTVYSIEQQTGLNQFVAKTYLWMIVGLLISSVSAYAILTVPALTRIIFGNRFSIWAVFIVQLVLAYSLRIDPRKLENTAAYSLKFILYSAITGITFATVAMVYTSASIVQAFVSTAGVFGLLSLYGFTTKRDLTKIGQIAFVGLLGVIIATIINVFILGSSGMHLVISIIGMIVFIGLTMYDTQKMKKMYTYFENQPETHGSLQVALALELYLDFINMFLYILRLFGREK